jgi:hypothetical protein
MDTDEDIGDISCKQIIRKTAAANRNVPVSLFSRPPTLERLENAGPRWLIYRWATGQGAEQIARETGHETKDIYRMLKDLEKAIITEADTDARGSESVCSGSVLAHHKDLH